MTVNKQQSRPLGVHSLDCFNIVVPDIAEANRFYSAFGLDVHKNSESLELYTDNSQHRWGRILAGQEKRLHHVTFGAFARDMAALEARFTRAGVARVNPPRGFESNGIWVKDFDGNLIEIIANEKSSPNQKTVVSNVSSPPGVRGATIRSAAPQVRPQRLSHVLLFSSDIQRSIRFYTELIGLRLSDEAGAIAFLHGVHGSDHHMFAFAKSDAPGFHHASWDVSSFNEVGLGAMQMAKAGYERGWGTGRHVLGSNYFHYVRDPWGSYCEYSNDIDYIPATTDWTPGHFEPEDSFYLWGPEAPDEFVINYESKSIVRMP